MLSFLSELQTIPSAYTLQRPSGSDPDPAGLARARFPSRCECGTAVPSPEKRPPQMGGEPLPRGVDTAPGRPAPAPGWGSLCSRAQVQGRPCLLAQLFPLSFLGPRHFPSPERPPPRKNSCPPKPLYLALLLGNLGQGHQCPAVTYLYATPGVVINLGDPVSKGLSGHVHGAG